MRRVANYPLWIGNALDGANVRAIHDAGITALVDLAANEPVPTLTRELIYCRFPIVDGAENQQTLLRLAIQTTAGLLERSIPTLVFCSAGMSRSLAVAAVALALITRKPPDECLEIVVGDGPRDLAPNLWHDATKCWDGLPPRSGESL